MFKFKFSLFRPISATAPACKIPGKKPKGKKKQTIIPAINLSVPQKMPIFTHMFDIYVKHMSKTYWYEQI
ncbi:hypothetical protein B5F99_18045 [Odoribacter splanchnicus]|nr:hypothetical protein B5F99_18045 [Odoribacter splanchnicus]